MKRSSSWTPPPLLNCLAVLLAAAVGETARAQPPTSPAYSSTFEDAVTGNNTFKKDGRRYWYVTPGADVYKQDTYERPTTGGTNSRSSSVSGRRKSKSHPSSGWSTCSAYRRG